MQTSCTLLPARVPYVTSPYRSRVNAIPNLVPPFGPCCQALVTPTQLMANAWLPYTNQAGQPVTVPSTTCQPQSKDLLGFFSTA